MSNRDPQAEPPPGRRRGRRLLFATVTVALCLILLEGGSFLIWRFATQPWTRASVWWWRWGPTAGGG